MIFVSTLAQTVFMYNRVIATVNYLYPTQILQFVTARIMVYHQLHK